jgi:hypothetical protein
MKETFLRELILKELLLTIKPLLNKLPGGEKLLSALEVHYLKLPKIKKPKSLNI